VKLWADANDGTINKAANRHRNATPAYRDGTISLKFHEPDCDGLDCDGFDCDRFDCDKADFDDSDFNMSRFRFK
jgi:hypothetical protein